VSHTVSPDVHRIIVDAITAIRSGDKARGRTLLAQALRIDPRNEAAWLGMASVAETPERRRECLERALTINPNSQIARRALQKLSDPQPSHTSYDAGALDQAARPLPSFTPMHAQTVTQEGETPQDQARHCPLEIGEPIGIEAFEHAPHVLHRFGERRLLDTVTIGVTAIVSALSGDITERSRQGVQTDLKSSSRRSR
jgi:hypothetical protein